MPRYSILKVESYEGDDTFVRCVDGVQEFLFAVIAIDDDGEARTVDSGYRSLAEAVQAWPEMGSWPDRQVPA